VSAEGRELKVENEKLREIFEFANLPDA